MLRIGLIGAGRMGNAHSGNLVKVPGVKLTAVYDICSEKSKAYAEKYGTKICLSAKEVAESSDVDLILICSPTYAHCEGLDAAMSTGKAVFCEKPLCRTEEELTDLRTRLEAYQGFFAVGFVRRYSAGLIRLNEIITSGGIGKLICGEIRCLLGSFARMKGDWFTDYRLCGGVMLDMLAHHIDLQNLIAGKPESVYAQALMLDEKLGLPCDFVSATAKFKNGFISNIQCSWMRNGPSDTQMTVYGEKGALTFSDSGGLVLYRGSEKEIIPLNDGEALNIHEIEGGMYMNEMFYLVDAVKKGRAPLAGKEEAVAAMEFCLGMMKSAETGKIVRF